jgi:hypothetical protein
VSSGLLGGGELSGTLAGTDLGYGAAASNSLLAGGGAASGGTGAMSGALAGTDMGYGGAAMANAPSAQPGLFAQMSDAAHSANRAANAYNSMQNGMGANQQPRPAPPPQQPIYQGPAPQISAPVQGLMGNPQANQFAQMLLAQRQRGMLS